MSHQQEEWVLQCRQLLDDVCAIGRTLEASWSSDGGTVRDIKSLVASGDFAVWVVGVRTGVYHSLCRRLARGFLLIHVLPSEENLSVQSEDALNCVREDCQRPLMSPIVLPPAGADDVPLLMAEHLGNNFFFTSRSGSQAEGPPQQKSAEETVPMAASISFRSALLQRAMRPLPEEQARVLMALLQAAAYRGQLPEAIPIVVHVGETPSDSWIGEAAGRQHTDKENTTIEVTPRPMASNSNDVKPPTRAELQRWWTMSCATTIVLVPAPGNRVRKFIVRTPVRPQFSAHLELGVYRGRSMPKTSLAEFLRWCARPAAQRKPGLVRTALANFATVKEVPVDPNEDVQLFSRYDVVSGCAYEVACTAAEDQPEAAAMDFAERLSTGDPTIKAGPFASLVISWSEANAETAFLCPRLPTPACRQCKVQAAAVLRVGDGPTSLLFWAWAERQRLLALSNYREALMSGAENSDPNLSLFTPEDLLVQKHFGFPSGPLTSEEMQQSVTEFIDQERRACQGGFRRRGLGKRRVSEPAKRASTDLPLATSDQWIPDLSPSSLQPHESFSGRLWRLVGRSADGRCAVEATQRIIQAIDIHPVGESLLPEVSNTRVPSVAALVDATLRVWQQRRRHESSDGDSEDELARLKAKLLQPENVLEVLIQCGLECMAVDLAQIVVAADPSLAASELLTTTELNFSAALLHLSRLSVLAESAALCSRAQLPWDATNQLLRQTLDNIRKPGRPIFVVSLARNVLWDLLERWSGILPPAFFAVATEDFRAEFFAIPRQADRAHLLRYFAVYPAALREWLRSQVAESEGVEQQSTDYPIYCWCCGSDSVDESSKLHLYALTISYESKI